MLYGQTKKLENIRNSIIVLFLKSEEKLQPRVKRKTKFGHL